MSRDSKPRNVFLWNTAAGGVRELDERIATARLKVLARRCDHCGREPCACAGPERSEWCAWCEGLRRLRHKIVHLDTGERLDVCADCWGPHFDQLIELEPPETRWRQCCLYCDAPEVRGRDGLCASPACRERLDDLERRIADRIAARTKP